MVIALTGVQKKILLSIYLNGSFNSLFQLAMELDIHYENARQSVWRLQQAGLLHVERPNNHSLLLTIGGPMNQQQLEPPPGAKYPRPELSPEEENKLRTAVNRLNLMQSFQRQIIMLAVLEENMRLLKECNQHREQQGLDLLPVYDPITGKRIQ